MTVCAVIRKPSGLANSTKVSIIMQPFFRQKTRAVGAVIDCIVLVFVAANYA